MISERLRRTADEMRNFSGPPEMAPGPDADDIAGTADVIDALVAATPDLSCTISWLEGGCDPLMAAKELRIYRERIDAALALARRK